jgi:hypothetical protein
MLEETPPEQDLQKVAKVAKKMRLSEQPSDFSFWQTQPYELRLATLEQIRREYIAWKYGSEPGFQRVYTIFKRK